MLKQSMLFKKYLAFSSGLFSTMPLKCESHTLHHPTTVKKLTPLGRTSALLNDKQHDNCVL